MSRLEDVAVPKPYPCEFREGVVRFARNREAGVTLAQVGVGFGVHEITLSKWMRQADVEDGAKPGVPLRGHKERSARNRWNRS